MVYRVLARKAYVSKVNPKEAAKSSAQLAEILMDMTEEVLGVDIKFDLIDDLTIIRDTLLKEREPEE